MYTLFLLIFLTQVIAQGKGHYEREIHPKLNWQQCDATGTCQTVQGEVVLDAEWRWIHVKDSWESCFDWGEWNTTLCPTGETCAENCVLEGVEDYRLVFGITTDDDSIRLNYRTYIEFTSNINSRVFLMENQERYQMFELLGNEVSVDVDLSTVECGINAALYFVAMDPDGGLARHAGNRAGAEYGTGYCDSSCPRSNRFVAGKANVEFWRPEDDFVNGMGMYGACCPKMAVLNSNAHSYSTSTHICSQDEYHVCEQVDCDHELTGFADRLPPFCDKWGCDYNPYRLGVTDFYGKGKQVDTTRKFTFITRFESDKVTQLFIQDGEKIEPPVPTEEGFGDDNGITEEYCVNIHNVFDGQSQYYPRIGGYPRHQAMLDVPMVLAMSISHDIWGWGLWLDSLWPPGYGEEPGFRRGDCVVEDNNPDLVQNRWADSRVVWSNIRFGPIGSTTEF